MQFRQLSPPTRGERVTSEKGRLAVPDDPIIPVIVGDGTGPDIFRSGQPVLDAAVKKAYHGKRKLIWFQVPAGEAAIQKYNDILPEDTVNAIRHYTVAIKGPLITPVGGGFRSLNVTLRQELDLFACVRPVRWFPEVPSPMVHPDKLNVVIFRENIEDVYAGLEWKQGSAEAKKMIEFVKREMGEVISEDSGIGLKSISVARTKRLVRAAIRYALQHQSKSVTIVHKGNIMKYTEGAFREWGYEVTREEFGDMTVTEEELASGKPSEGRMVVKDRIADSMFQQLLLRPDEYDVIATPNLNGDYLSDACAAQVGGIGMAPGANINYETGVALFEATHGAAPKYANKDVVNPSSFILSGVMMLGYLGWQEAADTVIRGLEKTIRHKTVTYDLARLMTGAKEVKCSEFGKAIIANMQKLP